MPLGMTYNSSDVVRADRQVALSAVSKDPAALRLVGDEGLLGDKEIILTSRSGASSEQIISALAYYHFTRNNVDFDVPSLKGKVNNGLVPNQHFSPWLLPARL